MWLKRTNWTERGGFAKGCRMSRLILCPKRSSVKLAMANICQLWKRAVDVIKKKNKTISSTLPSTHLSLYRCKRPFKVVSLPLCSRDGYTGEIGRPVAYHRGHRIDSISQVVLYIQLYSKVGTLHFDLCLFVKVPRPCCNQSLFSIVSSSATNPRTRACQRCRTVPKDPRGGRTRAEVYGV